jgi:hypothetical protein
LPATIALYRRFIPRRGKTPNCDRRAEGLVHRANPEPPNQPRT